MNVKVLTSENFRRKAKKLMKKYVSLKSELFELYNQLLANPETGTQLGNNCYKIRLAVQSKGKGKSGGLRIITHLIIKIEENSINDKIVGLITIYDKLEYENISDKDIEKLVEEIYNEIKESW